MYVPPRHRVARSPYFLALLICGCLIADTGRALADHSAKPTAIEVMLQKADFWYQHGQEKIALDTFQRVLSLEPANTVALAGAARMALILDQHDLALGYIERLQKIAPDDPALPELASVTSRQPDQVRALTEARHLAAGGNHKEAIERYKTLFVDGKIPDDLAGEYYHLALQDTTEGSADAERLIDEMTEIADRHQQDPNFRFALANCLTLIGDHREDGIDIYARLARIPSMKDRVQPVWREVMLWSGVDVRMRDQLNDYLTLYPSDPQLDAMQETMRRELPSPARLKLIAGNSAFAGGNLDAAEKAYTEATALDPNEPDSFIMLAILRAKQGRMDEAKRLADQAIILAPQRKDEILADIGQDPETLRRSAEAANATAAQYRQVEQLAEAGHYDQAEALLRKLIGTNEDPGSLLLLADLRRRAGDSAGEMSLLQHVAQIAPNNGDAYLALASAQIRADRISEGSQSLDRADILLRNSESGSAKETAAKRLALRKMRADLLRRRAENIHDPHQLVQILRQAASQDPDNLWTVLALARALEDLGQRDEAVHVIAPVLAEAQAPNASHSDAGIDAINVSLGWFQQHQDTDRAMRLAMLLPVGKRSAEMQNLISMAELRQRIAVILQGPSVRRDLLALAAHPDPDGSRGDLIGRQLLRVAGPAVLIAGLQAGLSATPPPQTEIRLRYASLLSEAQMFDDANAVLDPLDPRLLNRTQRANYDLIYDFITVAEINEALRLKEPARAQAALQRRAERVSTSEPLQVAAARIRIALGAPQEALSTLSTMLHRDPGDTFVRTAAIDAAVASHNVELAADLADEGLRLHPDSVQLLMQASYVARIRDRNRDALEFLRRARSLQQATDKGASASGRFNE